MMKTLERDAPRRDAIPRHRRERREARRRARGILVVLLAGLLLHAAGDPGRRDAAARRDLRLARSLRRASPGAFRLNADTAPRLRLLPGIGPALARRILAYRRRLGPFRSVGDLSLLPGLGKNQLLSILPMLDLDPR